jgi:hypothetical protein
MALAAMVRSPQPTDREIFSEFIEHEDPTTSLLAFTGLKKLLPAPLHLKGAWNSIFSESVDLLSKRACSGPVQLRVAALKALAFAPDHLNISLVEPVLKSLEDPVSYESVLIGQTPELVLVQNPQKFYLPEGFALLLASLPGGQNKLKLLQRELYSSDPARLLPVLLALQYNPIPGLTDEILALARFSDPRVALEAARALTACGGQKVIMVLLALLKETTDPAKKAWLLPLVASTGREEVWPIIKSYATADNSILQLAALKAAKNFPIPAEEKAILYNKLMQAPDPAISCRAAALAWQTGSMRGLHHLEQSLFTRERNYRLQTAYALTMIAPDTAAFMLSSRFDVERSGDVVRQMILSMRKILPKIKNNFKMHDMLHPWFKRLMKSTDPFKRSQAAVLCGILGKSTQDLILSTLNKEHHPHVIASLLSALGRIGTDRLLVYSAFNDHPDPRIRANMINSMLVCGNDAMPYFTAALSDPSPRVRSSAARNLFLLGQLDIVAELNRMLLIPSPVSVLSGCYGLGRLLRIQPPALDSDHPLGLAISRKIKQGRTTSIEGPAMLASPELPEVFKEMSIAGGNIKKLLWLIEEKHKRYPQSHGIRRILASLATSDGQYDKAATLLAKCLAQQPMILADLLDAYRLALKNGDLDAATSYGNETKKLYQALLDGCKDLCRSLRGSGAETMYERLHHLQTPSMNLYNAMIQLKVIEKDVETVLDLLTELALARPVNPMVIKRLHDVMPPNYSELKEALNIYYNSIC